MVLKGKYLFISIIFTIFAGKISAMGYLKDIIQQRQGHLEKSEAKLVRQFIISYATAITLIKRT